MTRSNILCDLFSQFIPNNHERRWCEICNITHTYTHSQLHAHTSTYLHSQTRFWTWIWMRVCCIDVYRTRVFHFLAHTLTRTQKILYSVASCCLLPLHVNRWAISVIFCGRHSRVLLLVPVCVYACTCVRVYVYYGIHTRSSLDVYACNVVVIHLYRVPYNTTAIWRACFFRKVIHFESKRCATISTQLNSAE